MFYALNNCKQIFGYVQSCVHRDETELDIATELEIFTEFGEVGCDMPTVAVYSSGHLAPSNFFKYLCMFSL